MDTKTKIGLTIGKFAPLHKGHQFLIETALFEMDELAVLIYDCPDITDIPLPVRAEWIRKLYPGVRLIEAFDSPKKIGKDEESIRVQIDYIISKVKDLKITHFYSSEWYGEYVSRALGAKNVLIDPERKRFPISGTLSRENLEKYKNMLEVFVYDDMIKYSN
ncbi:MAG: adenylyltransferase/cytidyltransferase family protein [Minisyncoccia bacterium]